jgi:hypothetical protein
LADHQFLARPDRAGFAVVGERARHRPAGRGADRAADRLQKPTILSENGGIFDTIDACGW